MRNQLANMPPVVKYLLIINGAMYLITYLAESMMGIHLADYLGLHYFQSGLFEPYQIISHMFMHGSLIHLFFNMYALFLFGSILERNNVWGSQKFFIYYMVTGLGAAALHVAVSHFEIQSLMANMPQEKIDNVLGEGYKILLNNQNYTDPQAAKLNILVNIATVGASGAVFGLLLAFGMLFPNIPLQLMFIPIPIKAKYFVMGYGAIELLSGLANREGDNVAHFAHLGGMLFGFILIKLWQKNKHR